MNRHYSQSILIDFFFVAGKLRRKRQKKDNDVDAAQVKYVPNIRESNGIGMKNEAEQMVNPQPLIDLCTFLVNCLSKTCSLFFSHLYLIILFNWKIYS